MDYRRFRELREPTWAELDAGLARAKNGRPDYRALERLAFLYRQVLHDHSVARSRFPGTAVVQRLQTLVLAATHVLQRDFGDEVPTLRHFVTRLFPVAIREVLPAIAVALAIFVAATLLGVAMTAIEPGVGGIYLPPEVIADLRQGKLWTESIFAVTPGSVASSGIATNNLSVLFTAFGGGVLAGFGAIFVLLTNGLMLGSILTLTAHYGMSGSLMNFIAAHGPLELSLIVVSAGCGLHMGRALLEPSDRPRGDSWRIAGRQALLVLAGAAPFIVILGIVEGYISPGDLPFRLKVLVGLCLEAIFLVWCAWPVPPAELHDVRRDLRA